MGQQWQDSHESTVGTGHLVHDKRCDNGTGQPRQVSLDNWPDSSARTGQGGQVCQEVTAKTGQEEQVSWRQEMLKQDSWGRTAWAGQSEQDSQRRQSGGGGSVVRI